MAESGSWDAQTGPWSAPKRPGWRPRLKRALLRLAAAGHSANDPRDGVAILAYHGTEPDRAHPWWSDFKGQMSLLDDLGYEVVPLARAVEQVRSGHVSARPAVAITFDDGWANNLDVAYPELARRGWPSSVFLATSFIGRRPFLLDDEVRRLADFGTTAELHTDAHPDLTTIDEHAILEDLTRCNDRIASLTGRAPRFLCYPFGHVDRRVRDVVVRTGVEAACSGLPGRNRPGEDLWLLRRVTVDPGDGPSELRAGLAGGALRLARLNEFVSKRASFRPPHAGRA